MSRKNHRMTRKDHRYLPPAEDESGVSIVEIITFKAVYLLTWVGDLRSDTKGLLTCVKGEAEGPCGRLYAHALIEDAKVRDTLEVVTFRRGSSNGMWRTSRVLGCKSLTKAEDLRVPSEPAMVSSIAPPPAEMMSAMVPVEPVSMVLMAKTVEYSEALEEDLTCKAGPMFPLMTSPMEPMEQETLASPLFISEDLRNARAAQRMAREQDACWEHRVSQPGCPNCL